MNDLIDRQAAIGAVNELSYLSSLVDVKRILIDLPSTQPEIILCKDCANRYCYSQCYFFADDEYCAWAERKAE